MLTVDYSNATVRVTADDGNSREFPFASQEAFSAVSKAWLRVGWDLKHTYSFTWLGRPVVQLPEDMIRLQEVIYAIKPDVIVECGVAHGGMQIFYASLCRAMNKGRVIGVDVEIRPHNRQAIESHELSRYVTLIEGGSVEPETVELVKAEIKATDKCVIVMLDSNHSKDHVLAELRAYSPLVTPGSYIVAMDGIMEDMIGAPRSKPDWKWNNPKQAALEFVANDPRFVIDEPKWVFNEGATVDRVTYWPSAFIKRTHQNERV